MNARALLRRISPEITPARPSARARRTSSGSRPTRWAWRRISASTSSSLASKALGLGHRLQHQLGADGPLGLGAQVGLHVVAGLPQGLEVLLQVGAHHAQLLGEPVGPVVQLVVDHRLGQGNLDLVEVGLEDPGLQLAGPLRLGRALQALAQVGPELLQGVELAGLLGEVVVQLGQDLGLGLLDQDLEGDLAAGQLLAGLLGQGGVEAEDVALALALQLLVQLGYDGARADLVEEVGAGQLRDLVGVVGGPQVDLGEVALGQRAADDLQLGGPLAQALELGVDVLVGDLEGRPLDLDPLVGGQARARA
jgi:hypothetical protein